ncbi:hypothetical protein ARMGADRAFT_475652 [Armillaria gallica]|uniref:Uncharacterized protein n=1 Tax=Armillaria gallica TaxID=47427 RepID=A0A2H3CVF5_ARMGA|nr:hypothetical protein ARMGADRAFT_475652 [Armillaria gallica]
MNHSQSVCLARRACTRLSFTELEFPALLSPTDDVVRDNLSFFETLCLIFCVVTAPSKGIGGHMEYYYGWDELVMGQAEE